MAAYGSDGDAAAAVTVFAYAVLPLSISIRSPEHSLDGSDVALCGAAATGRCRLWLDAGARRHGLPVLQQAQVLRRKGASGQEGCW